MSEDLTSLESIARRVVAAHDSVYNEKTNERAKNILYYGSPDDIVACTEEELEAIFEVARKYRAAMLEYAQLSYDQRMEVNKLIERDSQYYAKPPSVIDLREKKERDEE